MFCVGDDIFEIEKRTFGEITINDSGTITIPAEIPYFLGLKEGSKLEVEAGVGTIVLKAIKPCPTCGR